MRGSSIFFWLSMFLSIQPAIYSSVFHTLNEAQIYADSLDQDPDIDNNDWLNPIFNSFHKKNLPTTFSNFLMALGIKKRPSWAAHGFKILLQKLVKERTDKNYFGRFIQKIVPEPGAIFIIWGDLHGAFHSLDRGLQELKQHGILDNSFKIINPHYYFIFNGNLVNRSPFILETLTLAMRLMEVNPDKVIYIRGNHENKEYWHSHGLKRELEIRARNVSKEKIPLGTLVTSFFNTLPLALYLVAGESEESIDVVRISHFARDYEELEEEKYAGFLEKSEESHLFNLINEKPSSKSIKVKAIIEGKAYTDSYTKTQGLQLLKKDIDSTAWAIHSFPTGTYRRLHEAFYDAYVALSIYPNLDDWTLTLYNQDVRKMLGFKKAKEFNLISGLEIIKKITIYEALKKEEKELKKKLKEAKEKMQMLITELEELKAEKIIEVIKPIKPEIIPEVVEKKEINFGTTMDLSKGAKWINHKFKTGLLLALNKENRAGGIKGKKLDLIAFDDEYTPSKARKNIEKLLTEFGIDLILSPFGTPTLEDYFDLVKEGKVLVLLPFTGTDLFRKPDLKYLIHFQPSYSNFGYLSTKYSVETLKSKKIAFFYQNDTFGLSMIAGGKQALQELGIKNWLEIPYERNGVNFSSQVEEIKGKNPDAILFFSTTTAMQELIEQAGLRILLNKQLITEFVEKRLQDFIKDKGLKVIYFNMLPNPKTNQLEIVKEFREEAKRRKVLINFITLLGYVYASIVIDMLKKITGPISKEKIIKVAENIKDYNFKGLRLHFNPQTRELSDTYWIDTGEKEWEPIKIKAKVKKELKKEPVQIIKNDNISQNVIAHYSPMTDYLPALDH